MSNFVRLLLLVVGLLFMGSSVANAYAGHNLTTRGSKSIRNDNVTVSGCGTAGCDRQEKIYTNL